MQIYQPKPIFDCVLELGEELSNCEEKMKKAVIYTHPEYLDLALDTYFIIARFFPSLKILVYEKENTLTIRSSLDYYEINFVLDTESKESKSEEREPQEKNEYPYFCLSNLSNKEKIYAIQRTFYSNPFDIDSPYKRIESKLTISLSKIKSTKIGKTINKKLEKKINKNVSIFFQLPNKPIDYITSTIFYSQDYISSKENYVLDEKTFNFFKLPVNLNYRSFIYNRIVNILTDLFTLNYVETKYNLNKEVIEKGKNDIFLILDSLLSNRDINLNVKEEWKGFLLNEVLDVLNFYLNYDNINNKKTINIIDNFNDWRRMQGKHPLSYLEIIERFIKNKEESKKRKVKNYLENKIIFFPK
ncbi:MAG: hypothetical protein QW622_01330 [Candidatus Pacearchaeota archaeon]